MTNQNTYYNYIYLDPRKPGRFEYPNLNFCLLYEPFYVGKGKGRRYLDHIKEAIRNNDNSYKENKIRKILNDGYNLKDYILRLNFTNIEKEALDYEIELIDKIGRIIYNKGPLTNIQTGGEGGSITIACYDKNGNKQIVTYEEYNSNKNLISVIAGTVPYKNIITGETGRINKEEFINNPNLVSTTKDKINVKDKDGNIFCVTKDDERYLNGELVNYHLGMKRSDESKKKMSEKSKGKVICIDDYGNKLRIDKKKFDNNPNLKGRMTNKVNCIYNGKPVTVNVEDYHNNPDFSHYNSNYLIVKDLNGNILRVNANDYHNSPDLQHVCKNMVPCKDLNGNSLYITKEEYHSRNDVFHANKGRKSHNIKLIEIYNNKDELVYSCNEPFKKFCKENNLPFYKFIESYKNNGMKLYPNDKLLLIAKRFGYERFQGWYAILK